MSAYSVLTRGSPHRSKTDESLYLHDVLEEANDMNLDDLRKSILAEDPTLTEKQVKSILDLMDRDKDGRVSKKEFLHRYCLNKSRFTKADTDKSGVLSFVELRAFMLSEDETTSEEDLKLFFERMDRDKDGSVKQSEFNHCYSLHISGKEVATKTQEERKIHRAQEDEEWEHDAITGKPMPPETGCLRFFFWELSKGSTVQPNPS
jgi:Ca2+-binding EF-hand superfamily protein